MRTSGRAVVAVAMTATAAALLVADPLGVVESLGIGDALAAWSAGPSQPGTIGGLADRAATREDRIATLHAILARDPALSASLLAVGGGLGLVVGGSVAYWRQRTAIRRGKEDA